MVTELIVFVFFVGLIGAILLLFAKWYHPQAITMVAERIIFQPPKRDVTGSKQYHTFVIKNRMAWVQITADKTAIKEPVVLRDVQRTTHMPYKQCIVFLHGNAADMEQTAQALVMWEESMEADIYIPEYPGYSLLNDMQASHAHHVLRDFMTNVVGPLRYQQVILIGHSLGTHFALRLAADRLCDQLVLIAPFSSVKAAAGLLGWFLPDDFMDSMPAARLVRRPTMVLHSPEDTIIKIEQGKEVYNEIRAPKVFREYHTGHNFDPIQLQSTIHDFIVAHWV
jgi:pimeloyl-ACP methyl ester carboxylesterase